MYWQLLPLALGIKIPAFVLFGMYGFDWNYASIEEFLNIAKSCMVSSSVFVALLFFLRDWPTFAGVPRSVFFIDFLLTLAGIGGVRLSGRIAQHVLLRQGNKEQGLRTLIVGAGDAGEQLLRSMLREKKRRFLPVGFVDDDLRKQGLAIHGVHVLGPRKSLPELIHRKRIEAVIIAMPSASSRAIRETVELARKGGAREIKIIPFLSELYTGEVSVSEIREVQAEDLLGREPVSIDIHEVKSFIEGKRVLITGAAGSIGSELCRQVLRFGPEVLLALDIDETGLFNLEWDLEKRFPVERFQIVIGDVRDRTKMKTILKKYCPQVVFHAAAYKHVPIMEAFPDEAIKTNVFGTQIMVEEACQAGVETFVLISTDKAVNPVSVMGMTKRVAEMIILVAGKLPSTRCMAVRFGNILGSRGSVLPLFLEQIRRRGPVTVTHPEMERYFMTTAEAVLLVLQAAAMGKGGEVFVLDMGKPIRIVDLAKELIRLHGLEPDKDIPIVFTGVRPGEKLKEEILTAEEGVEATRNKQIFTARLSAKIPEAEFTRHLQRLAELVTSGGDGEVIKNLLRELIFGPVQA
ncbi:MAG: polysaccharide biosynthesis protein [Candidatus Caldatribacteriaceae bacterium]